MTSYYIYVTCAHIYQWNGNARGSSYIKYDDEYETGKDGYYRSTFITALKCSLNLPKTAN